MDRPGARHETFYMQSTTGCASNPTNWFQKPASQAAKADWLTNGSAESAALLNWRSLNIQAAPPHLVAHAFLHELLVTYQMEELGTFKRDPISLSPQWSETLFNNRLEAIQRLSSCRQPQEARSDEPAGACLAVSGVARDQRRVAGANRSILQPRDLWAGAPETGPRPRSLHAYSGQHLQLKCRPGMSCCTTFTTHHQASSQAHWCRGKLFHSN